MIVIETYIVLTGIGCVGFWLLAATGRDRKVTRHDAPAATPLRKAA